MSKRSANGVAVNEERCGIARKHVDLRQIRKLDLSAT